ncbi:hypothetical protein [Arsenicicoccus sp. oral taxon 190]|uniref:hypothetical protein n=1 Tax=Arsenicicoccus sp. oral taxon 190 TaxID=1658671 RepID=UPI00067A046C|nr:hypothetical protein [Arsenicicoccus sp. oral taxon 190]AKT50968.1 hypothetical protein ADJ73_05920 [Arsenicicoccus sp. oral taxon 190]
MGLHIGNNVALGIQGALVGTDLATRQSNATATVVEALAQLAVAALAAAIIVRLGRCDEVRRPREV